MSLRDDIVRVLHEHPPVNPGCRSMLGLIVHSDADMRELTRLIEADTSVCALIRSAARTAEAAGAPADMPVSRAVSLLGRDRTCRLLALAACSTFMRSDIPAGDDFYTGGLWRHSAATAVAADVVTAMLGVSAEHNTVFVAALLHDIGKVALAPFVVRHLAPDCESLPGEPVSFEVRERTVLGIDHGEAGAILLRQWGMPAELYAPVHWHHEPDGCPEGPSRRVVDIVHLADSVCLAGGIGAGVEGLQYRLSASVLERLRMKKNMIETIMSRTMEQLDELIQTIEV